VATGKFLEAVDAAPPDLVRPLSASTQVPKDFMAMADHDDAFGYAADDAAQQGRGGLPMRQPPTLEPFNAWKLPSPRESCDNAARGVCVLENLLVILVVEDDHLIQTIVTEAMTEAGFEIVMASSGEQAVELLDSPEGQFRALVTDINLGGDKLSGWDVARHAREINPDFPVVYMSGESAADWASKGVPHSIMVAKPFAPAQLVTAVSQLLNTRTPTN